MKHLDKQAHITIGYARVSSSDERQSLGLEVQTSALSHCDLLFFDKQSGGKNERPQLSQALQTAKDFRKKGKQVSLVIYKLDRLTRRMVKLLHIIEDLNAHGIELISLKEKLETDSLTGKLLCMILGYVAEMELENIRSRTKEGLQKAKEKGVKLGNKGLPEETKKQVLALSQEGKSARQIATICKISRSSVYNILKAHK